MSSAKIIIVMPAYNAELTLEKTYKDIPKDVVSEVILCDDFSSDGTLEIAKKLKLETISHDRNMGYGGNQKTCYREALGRGADIVVMLHPDYQYDAKKIPELIKPILKNEADVVLGSRILNGDALKGGMPLCKYISNRLSTIYENKVLGLNLSEYHTGLRAYSRGFLERVDWQNYSDDFLFDGQILIDAARLGFKIAEIPIETRYFKEASQISISRGIKYGAGIFFELQRYKKKIRCTQPTKKSGGLAAFLVFLLLVFSLIEAWNYGQLVPGIDFYKFWAVGRAVRSEGIDIYTTEAQKKIGLDFLRRSYQNPGSGRFRWAAANCKTIEIYSSPLLYSLFSIGSPLDYERDFQIYLLLRLCCIVFAIMALCRLLRYSFVASMALAIIFTMYFEPFLSDLRIANVNQIQLALLVLFLWVQSRCWRIRDFLGGFILGASLMFKPNVILVPMVLYLYWLINRRFRKVAHVSVGIIISIVCSMAISGFLFGSIKCWSLWIKAMLSLQNSSIEVIDGNVSPAMLVYEWFGVQISLYLTAIFLAVTAVFIWLNRHREKTGVTGEVLMVGMGCVIYMISARLIWLHYLILTIPMMLFVLRPQYGIKKIGLVIRRCFGVLAILATGLIPAQLLFGVNNPEHLAIMASAGMLILFCQGLWDIKTINSACKALDTKCYKNN